MLFGYPGFDRLVGIFLLLPGECFDEMESHDEEAVDAGLEGTLMISSKFMWRVRKLSWPRQILSRCLYSLQDSAEAVSSLKWTQLCCL
jgi:hypothetical protein